MTEKEKRDSGALYQAGEFADEMLRCKDQCFAYNQLRPTQTRERQALMKQLLGKTGEDFCILAPFWCDYGYNIEIGEHFFANHNCVILDGAKVTFGDHVFIGPDCGFYTAGHPLDAPRRNQGLEYAKPITVGNSVWFGGGVRVCPGVTIGDGAVIAALSVVTEDIPSGCLAGGVPAKVIRKL